MQISYFQPFEATNPQRKARLDVNCDSLSRTELSYSSQKIKNFASLAKTNLSFDLHWRFVNQIHVFPFIYFFLLTRQVLFDILLSILFRFVSHGKSKSSCGHEVEKRNNYISFFFVELFSAQLFNEI